MRIHNDIFDCIGGTPVIRLPELSAELGVELFGKAEFLNPGGSIKDRIAHAMIAAAESEGRLAPGMMLVEATAGNTGIGLAWVAAARGYRFLAVMSETDRGPKVDAMESMGAEVVLTPPGTPWKSDRGPLGVAARLARERDGFFVNQFDNPANPVAHETTTAVEIREAMGDELDAVVLGIGSGGTATGLGRGLKPSLPGLRLIGVAGASSYLAKQPSPGDRIAGISPDFAPATFESGLVDHVECVPAEQAAWAARRMAELEGVPAGHSSGACLLAAQKEARERPGSRILLILGDGNRHYPGLGRVSARAA